jgi:hypothetical protein
MKIKTVQTTSNLTTIEDLGRFVSISLSDIIDAINGRLGFIDNIQSKLVDVDFNLVNTNIEIHHGLPFVPNGYFVVQANAPVSVYSGDGDATSTIIFLKSDAIAKVKILFF